jgi:hypothetical protein
MNGKLSTLSTVIYFVNKLDPNYPQHYHVLAPYSSFATPWGWERREADDLPSVDQLQRTLENQERRKAERDIFREETVFSQLRNRVRDSLYERMVSDSTSQYEKDYIREYLKLREEKRHKYQQRFRERALYLAARENDARPGRKPNEEVTVMSDIEKRLSNG